MGCSASRDPAVAGRQAPPPAVAQGQYFEEMEAEPTGPDLREDTPYVWYWEEDAHRLANHRFWDKQGNFVAYPPKVSTYLEAQFQSGKSADALDITYKAFHAHTGYSYGVDFRAMKQINKGTGYRRTIMRRQNPHYVAPAVVHAVYAAPVEAGEGAVLQARAVERPQTYGPPPAERLFSGAVLKHIPLADFEKEIAGCDVNYEAKAGGTLLTWAAENHRADLCRSLLDKHADPLKEDWTSRQTALQWAQNTVAVGEDAATAKTNRDATIAALREATPGD